jgi:hypothetical protein
MSGDWMNLRNGQRMRRLPDGKWLLERKEPTSGPVIDGNKAMKKAVQGNLRSTEAKDCDLRIIGRMPETAYAEMVKDSGGDPDKEHSYFREHPEYLVVPENSAQLPKRKVFSFPNQRRRR